MKFYQISARVFQQPVYELSDMDVNNTVFALLTDVSVCDRISEV